MIDRERVVKNFIELVSVPCPSLDEKAEAELIAKKFLALGAEVKEDDAGKKGGSTTGNLWITLNGNVAGATRLLFEAHMDSVAPTTGTKVVRKNGVLYSDGTTTLGGDDKVGIAAMLEALQVIKEEKIPHGDIQCVCAIGEEIGSIGMKFLDPSWIKADVGYTLDCGGHLGQIFNSSPKGIVLTFHVKGRAAHAGESPEKGINAIMLAASGLMKLPWYGRLDSQTTLSVGKISGGRATNIVAEECEFTIDMRCPDEKKLNELRDNTIAIITEAVTKGGASVFVNELVTGPAVYVKPDETVARLAARAAKNLGAEPEFCFCGGLSDANFLCGAGLPTVNLATGMEKIHTTEEELAESDLVNTAEWMLEIIKEAAK